MRKLNYQLIGLPKAERGRDDRRKRGERGAEREAERESKTETLSLHTAPTEAIT